MGDRKELTGARSAMVRAVDTKDGKRYELLFWLSTGPRNAVTFQETLSSRRFKCPGNITKNTFVGQSVISLTRINFGSAIGFSRLSGN